jgi:hypothetical protein
MVFLHRAMRFGRLGERNDAIDHRTDSSGAKIVAETPDKGRDDRRFFFF